MRDSALFAGTAKRQGLGVGLNLFCSSNIFLTLIAIPSLMVLLSMTLPARVNRAANLVVASLYIPVTVFNAVGESWTYFYGLSIGIEVLLLVFILRAAWTWPRTTSSSMTKPAAPQQPPRGMGRQAHGFDPDRRSDQGLRQSEGIQ